MAKLNKTLREVNPEAAAMWVYELNGDMTPDNVGGSSDKEAWFRCLDNPKHLFLKRINKMTSDRDGHNIGCIYCGPNAKVAFPGETDLFTVCPEAEALWDFEQNEQLGLNPSELLPNSNKHAHFVCEHGHDEFRKIMDFTKAPYCQTCAHSLLINSPATGLFLDAGRNSLETITDYIISDRRMLYLKCPHCGYTWNWTGHLWNDRQYCPHCGYDGTEGSCEKNSFVKEKYHIITFRDANPVMAAIWDYDKNGDSTPDNVSSKSETEYAFRCDNGHEYSIALARLYDKKGNPKGCPICERKRTQVVPDISGISAMATETDVKKKRKVKVLDIKINQKKEKSDKETIAYENSFACRNPEAAALWNWELNGNRSPENTSKMTTKEVYLNCSRGKHAPYPVRVCDIKVPPYRCPECVKEDEEESYKKYSLKLNVPCAEEMWDKKKNTMPLEDARIYMDETAYFICNEGHSFPKTIRKFVSNQDCPICGLDSVAKYPHLVEQWDFEANTDYDIHLTSANSKDEVYWRCKKCGYGWKAQIATRKKSLGRCPCCEERIVVVKGITDLFTLVPEIEDYYDYDANIGIDPYTLSVASNTLVHWKCPDCGYRWVAGVSSRIIKEGDTYLVRECPSCSGSVRTKSYGEEYPDLISKFAEDLNGCTLYDIITHNDAKKNYFWNCDICGEEFPAAVLAMVRARNTASHGCPYCSGKKVLRENSFAARHPELMNEYDPENEIDPYTVTEGSNLPAKWICRNNHEHRWVATFRERSLGQGLCKICRDYYHNRTMLYEVYPELEKLYDTDLNERPFKMITLKSNAHIWLRCEEGHSFRQQVCHIVYNGNASCPYCNNRILLPGFNDLATLRPDLLELFDYEKNTKRPEELIINSNDDSIWWKCIEYGHSYQRSVMQMRLNPSCPICTYSWGKRGVDDAEAVYPELKKIWDYEKNDKKPYEIFNRNKDTHFFKCEHGHSYKTLIETIVNHNFECLVCDGTIIQPGVNSLSDTDPELSRELSPNEPRKPESLSKNYALSVLWRCPECGGEYPYPIKDRKLGDDSCPYCTGRRPLAGYNTLETVIANIDDVWDDSDGRSYTEMLPSYTFYRNWKCTTCGGVYRMRIDEFVEKQKNGEETCLYCTNEQPLKGYNTLKTVNPVWFSEWSYQNNYLICDPDEILPTYNELVWWECEECGYDYQMSPKDRGIFEMRHKIACPKCKGRRRKKRYFI